MNAIRAELQGSDTCHALGHTGSGKTPIFDLCRKLILAGQDPRLPLECFRGDTLALAVHSIGEGAELTIHEPVNGSAPKVARWKANPRFPHKSPARLNPNPVGG